MHFEPVPTTLQLEIEIPPPQPPEDALEELRKLPEASPADVHEAMLNGPTRELLGCSFNVNGTDAHALLSLIDEAGVHRPLAVVQGFNLHLTQNNQYLRDAGRIFVVAGRPEGRLTLQRAAGRASELAIAMGRLGSVTDYRHNRLGLSWHRKDGVQTGYEFENVLMTGYRYTASQPPTETDAGLMLIDEWDFIFTDCSLDGKRANIARPQRVLARR